MRLEECTFCGGKAIYLRQYSGERYCERCYINTVEKRVQHTISKYRMFRPEDRVALALSGGKDSSSLLHVMSELGKRFPLSNMVAVTIDEGIAGYRAEAIEIAEENCKKLDIEHRVYSFKKLYGYSLDEIVEISRRNERPFICSYCGILRRKALNIAAREVGASKLATAHNLDDEVQSMIMNILRGDLTRISRKEYDSKVEGLIGRVKPLCEIPENVRMKIIEKIKDNLEI